VTIDFNGSHYPRSVILYAVCSYLRYVVSCRDLEEIIVERGVKIDHATLNRRFAIYVPLHLLSGSQLRNIPHFIE
jgi:putative transposase